MNLFHRTRTGSKDDMIKKKKILISKEEFKKLHQDRIECSQALVGMEDEVIKTKKRLSLRNQELKAFRIERAEHLRRIEELEKQNEELLKKEKESLSAAASLKLQLPSSLFQCADGGDGDGDGDANTSCRWSNAVNDNNNSRKSVVQENIDYGYGNTEDSAPTATTTTTNNNNGSQDMMTAPPSPSSSSSSNVTYVDYGYGDTEDVVPKDDKKIKRQMARRGSTSRRASICVVRHDSFSNHPDGISTTTTTTTTKTTCGRSRNNSRDKCKRNNSSMKTTLKRPSISYNNLARQNDMDENSLDADGPPSEEFRTPFDKHERRPSKCRNDGTSKRQARRTSTAF